MRHADDEEGDQKGGAEQGGGEAGAGVEMRGGHGSRKTEGTDDVLLSFL